MFSWFRRKAPDVSHLETVVDGHSKAIRSILDDLERLENLHDRLRGVVYGRNLHKNPVQERTEEPPEPPNGAPGPNASRAELKAWLTRSGRFMPGKPPQHSE